MLIGSIPTGSQFLLLATLTLQIAAADGGPAIAHQPIETLARGQDLIVEATVTGSRPIARAIVSFQIGDRFGEAPLQRATPSTWRAQVPASRFDRSFSYIIHATDEGGRVSTWPSSGAAPPAQRVRLIEDAAAKDAKDISALPDSGDRHLLYVAVPGIRSYAEFGGVGVLVFDIADGHRFVKRIPTVDVPQGQTPQNVKGVALSVPLGLLYVTMPKRMIALDLKTERVVWNREYEGGCDRMALSPDGTLLYVPSLEGPHWHAVDARTGDVMSRIETNSGAHNTIYGLDGASVYLAGLKSPLLNVADPRTHSLVKPVGPFGNVIRPFTVNGRQTLCFVNVNGLLGFEVGDLQTGKMIHRVEVQGYKQGTGQAAQLSQPRHRADARRIGAVDGGCGEQQRAHFRRDRDAAEAGRQHSPTRPAGLDHVQCRRQVRLPFDRRGRRHEDSTDRHGARR